MTFPPCASACGSRLTPAAAARRRAASTAIDFDLYDVLVIGDSGGKDSTVAVDAACRQADAAGVLHKVRILHCDLGTTPRGQLIEWPGAEDLARRHAADYSVPFAVRRSTRWASLTARILSHGRWPGFFARYCTSDMKTAVGRDYIDELGRELRLSRPIRAAYILGMRADESRKRASMAEVQQHNMTAVTKRIVHTWLPIYSLTEDQVWKTIRRRRLPYHPAYDQGMRRLSCRLCPLAARDDLITSARLNPELADEFVELEERMGDPFKKNLSMRQIRELAA